MAAEEVVEVSAAVSAAAAAVLAAAVLQEVGDGRMVIIFCEG